MSRWYGRRICAVLFVVLALAAPTVATAHTPITGGRLYKADNVTLPWDFPATYPSWLQTAAKSALDTNQDDPATNNSRTPHFSFTAGGAGDVFYDGHASSPCGTGNLAWLQCANGGGSNSFNIYIRNFSSAPHGSWTWYDITGSCSAGQTCWYARRALIHETQHVTQGAVHNSQGESFTIMASTTPWDPNTGWNQTHLRRCDEARAQLLYDVRTYSGPYADCFDHITGHGVGGLITTASVTLPSYTACVGFSASTSGRVAVKTTSAYGLLTNNPLEGRTVRFDRKLSTSATWSSNVYSVVATAATTNWSRSIANPGSGNGTWNFRIHVDGEAGLDASNQPTFNITWTNIVAVC